MNFKVKNEIINSGFENDLNSWRAYGSSVGSLREITTTKAQSGEKALHIIRKAGGQYGFGYQQTELQSIIAGNQYYISANGFNISTNITTVSPVIEITGVVQLTFNTSIKDNWLVSSKIQEAPLDGTRDLLVFLTSHATEECEWFIDGICVVDLTKTFGAGNEPTKEEMDTLIDLLGGWFDGEITLTQKQIAIWTLNMIRQNRNAIISLGGTIL